MIGHTWLKMYCEFQVLVLTNLVLLKVKKCSEGEKIKNTYLL